MIFRLILLVSFLTAGSYCMSAECYNVRERECSQYNIDDLKDPENADELQNYCGKLLRLGDCILGVVKKCARNARFPHDTEKDVEIFRKILNYIRNSCDEDSRIFQAISSDISCVTSTLRNMDEICYLHNVNDTTREKLKSMIDEMPLCIEDSWFYSCVTATFKVNCAEDIADAVSDILKNLHFITDTDCTDMYHRVSYLGDAFEFEFRRGKSGQDVVPGVMEAVSKETD